MNKYVDNRYEARHAKLVRQIYDGAFRQHRLLRAGKTNKSVIEHTIYWYGWTTIPARHVLKALQAAQYAIDNQSQQDYYSQTNYALQKIRIEDRRSFDDEGWFFD